MNVRAGLRAAPPCVLASPAAASSSLESSPPLSELSLPELVSLP